MVTNRSSHITRHLVSASLGSFLYFPVWWYSRGLMLTLRRVKGFMGNRAADFGVRYWLKNLFRPMYGVSDLQGRIISFFMRLVVIFWYSILLLGAAALSLAFLLLYVSIVPLTVFMIWHQLGGSSLI